MSPAVVVAVLASLAAPESVSLMPVGLEDRQLTFRDAQGAHVVTFTLTERLDAARRDEDATVSRRLQVEHVVGSGKQRRKVWEAKDFVSECPFDLKLALVEGSIRVTDLDGDGSAEVSFAYLLSCKSDVSPDTLKFLMYEGKEKYALRGERWDIAVMAPPGVELDESCDPDPAFASGPKVFLEYALSRWKELVR